MDTDRRELGTWACGERETKVVAKLRLVVPAVCVTMIVVASVTLVVICTLQVVH